MFGTRWPIGPQVAVLGLLLARRAWSKEGWTDYRGRRRYDRFGDRLRKLGVGLLVHDVGKLAVPPEVLNKPARLSEAEMQVMRSHPEAGVELLRAADLSPLTLAVIRDHHERPDGVRHFRAVVMPYPVGHEVVTPDGRMGVVASVNPLDPDRPVVRLPAGRGTAEERVDMTQPPSVLMKKSAPVKP